MVRFGKNLKIGEQGKGWNSDAALEFQENGGELAEWRGESIFGSPSWLF